MDEMHVTNRELIDNKFEAIREKIAAVIEIITARSAAQGEAILKAEVFNKERITAVTDIINAKAQAQQDAITKAEVATDKRFESVNGFREQLSQTIENFATREALTAGLKENKMLTDILTEKQNRTENRLSNLEGRVVVYIGATGALVTCLAALFSYFGHILK